MDLEEAATILDTPRLRILTRVTIPMAGTKGSLNVSVATGILLHRWF